MNRTIRINRVDKFKPILMIFLLPFEFIANFIVFVCREWNDNEIFVIKKNVSRMPTNSTSSNVLFKLQTVP